jgi:hypothetical protein
MATSQDAISGCRLQMQAILVMCAVSMAAAASAATIQPFDVTWNAGSHLAWDTCAQWSSSHCPLPCSRVTVADDALLTVSQTEQAAGGPIFIRTCGCTGRETRNTPAQSTSAMESGDIVRELCESALPSLPLL